MSLSRYRVLSFAGFTLLASACADETQIQKPSVGAVSHAGADEPDADPAPETVDAGDQEVDAGDQEVDAGAPETDASSESPDASDSDADDTKSAGFPCEVEALLQARCQGCHSETSKTGVPLMTYEQLMAPAKVDPSVKVWKRALERMVSSERPMPPMGRGEPVTEEELSMFEAWIEQGMPADGCEQE